MAKCALHFRAATRSSAVSKPRLCKLYGLSEAIVAPLSSDAADPTAPIAAALGDHVSALLRNDMKIGLGWGRTLNSSLEYLSERSLKGLNVVSLVGGVTHFVADNPAEFPSGFARAFNADCYLIPSPALVDSPATKTALIERCGLKSVYDFAEALDAVVLSVGSLGPEASIARYAVIGEADRKTLGEYGAVGEMLCNVYDDQGRVIDHPLNQCVMSVPLEVVRAAPVRVLAAGGAHKLAAIRGALKLLEANHPGDRRGDRAQADGDAEVGIVGSAGPRPGRSTGLDQLLNQLAASRRASRCGMWPRRPRRRSAR